MTNDESEQSEVHRMNYYYYYCVSHALNSFWEAFLLLRECKSAHWKVSWSLSFSLQRCEIFHGDMHATLNLSVHRQSIANLSRQKLAWVPSHQFYNVSVCCVGWDLDPLYGLDTVNTFIRHNYSFAWIIPVIILLNLEIGTLSKTRMENK